jgi:hypothetical protein
MVPGRDGKQEGPFSDERLRELIASGMVRGDTRCGRRA